jgi:hypothetical protein
MRKLGMALVALFGLAQATGCIIVTDDDKGQFRVDWTANDTCENAGANAISVLVTRSGTSSGVDELFDCYGSSGQIFTPSYRTGSFTVVVAAIHDNDTPAYPGDDYVFDSHTFTNATISYDGEIVPLPQVDFDLLGVFDILFKVDFGASTGYPNCEATGSGGNGIHSQEIFLNPRGTTFDDAACYDYTLWGVDQEGLEFDGDTCGTTELCMENTVTQYVLDVVAGDYTLWIWGLKDSGGTLYDCYGGYTNVSVVSADANIGTILVPPITGAPAQCGATPKTTGPVEIAQASLY